MTSPVGLSQRASIALPLGSLLLLKRTYGHSTHTNPNYLTYSYSYNFENNVNLGTAKINELNSLFREKTDRGTLDDDVADLSKYWKQMPDNEKKQLINQLQTNCQKDIEKYENSNIYQGSSKSQNK